MEDIKEFGLQNPLVVKKLPDTDEYELISGERRWTALNQIHNENNSLYQVVMCSLFNGTDLDAAILLISANSTARVLSPIDKLKQIEKLTELYAEKKERGEKFNGKLRDKIAADVGVSGRQVGTYQKLSKHLTEEERNQLDSGELTFKEAEDIVDARRGENTAKKTKPSKEDTLEHEELLETSSDTGNLVLPNKNLCAYYEYHCSCGKSLISFSSNLNVLCEDCEIKYEKPIKHENVNFYKCKCGHTFSSTSPIEAMCEDCAETFTQVED